MSVKDFASQSRRLNPRALVAFTFCLAGVGLALLSFAANPPMEMASSDANSSGDSPLVGEPAGPDANSSDDSSLVGEPAGPISGDAAAATLTPTTAGWSVVTWPNNVTTSENDLNAVTCASASECWAVGRYYNGSAVAKTLIEKWNGTSWSIVTSPNHGTSNNFLWGVTCPSASECWAVGYYFSASAYKTLIEKWNGTAWSIVTSPNHGTSDNLLLGVTCASASECWAVGRYSNGSAAQTLIEKWNGTAWSIVTSPNHGTSYNSLLGVTCASASECWAVGEYLSVSNVYQTLIEKWNGTAWSIVTSPNHGTSYNYLNDVTCASASECWAVGYYYNGSAVAKTLIEKWNGTSWSIVTSPNHGTSNNFLWGVTCPLASECWAVGSYYDGSAPQTLIEKWNGTAWSIVTSPNHGTLDN